MRVHKKEAWTPGLAGRLDGTLGENLAQAPGRQTPLEVLIWP